MARRPLSKRLSLLLVALALAVVLARGYSRLDMPQAPHAPPPGPAAPVDVAPGEFLVKRAVDGDTLLLADGRRVRLIGVDTPEAVKPDAPVEPYGPEASDFTREFLRAAGMRVRLGFDRERTDQYGRTLAYVYAGDKLLNEELLRNGLATALVRHPYAADMKARFRAAQREAQQARRGIWSAPAR